MYVQPSIYKQNKWTNLFFSSQLLGPQAIKKLFLSFIFFPLHFWSPCPYMFYFLYFDIFKKDNINIDSIKKIKNDIEMSTLIAEHIDNKFLNSFEKMLKMLKMMQIH